MTTLRRWYRAWRRSPTTMSGGWLQRVQSSPRVDFHGVCFRWPIEKL